MANRPLIGVYANAPHQITWGNAFADGARKYGCEVRRASPNDHTFSPDVAVFWSHRQASLILRQKARGKEYIVLELPYWGPRNVASMQMCSAGWNGLNGRADFKSADSPPDRWERYGPGLKDWQTGGKYALIMGQVPGDMSHAHADIGAWYRRMVDEWSQVMPVAFRAHPKGSSFTGNVIRLNGPMDEALAQAAVAVTFNSNSGVDALIAGVPVYTEDPGSMAYNVSSHSVGEILRPDREQWAHDLAYCQWTLDEYRSGLAVEHLLRTYDGA